VRDGSVAGSVNVIVLYVNFMFLCLSFQDKGSVNNKEFAGSMEWSTAKVDIHITCVKIMIRWCVEIVCIKCFLTFEIYTQMDAWRVGVGEGGKQRDPLARVGERS